MRFFLPTFLSVFIGVALSLCLVPAVRAADPADFVAGHFDRVPNFAQHPTVQVGISDNGKNWSQIAQLQNLTANDIVLIEAGTTVIFDTQNVVMDTLGIEGKVIFATDQNTSMKVANILVYKTGTLQVGSEADPIQSHVRAEITIADKAIDPNTDPESFGTGLIAFGTWTMHGRRLDETFVRTAVEPKVGDWTLTLEASVNWKVGDHLIIPDTHQLGWKEMERKGRTYNPQWEDGLEIAAISDGGKLITLSQALAFDHLGGCDADGKMTFLPHIANLSRNVVIQSENPLGTRGHTMGQGRVDMDLRYVAFKDAGRTKNEALDTTVIEWTVFSESLNKTFTIDVTAGKILTSLWKILPSGAKGKIHMGRFVLMDRAGNDIGTTYSTRVKHVGTNQIARYAIHTHHVVGPEKPQGNGYQFTLIGNAVDNTISGLNQKEKWAITIHGSHYGLIQKNIVYNIRGGGIVTENGSETGNVFDGNYVQRAVSTGSGWRTSVEPIFGHTGREATGFWFRGPNNIVKNNVATNIRTTDTVGTAYGFKYMVKRTGNKIIPIAQGMDPHMGGGVTVDTHTQGIQFDNNEVYGATESGLTYWWVGSYGKTPREDAEQSIIRGLKVWHVYYNAIFEYPSSNILIENMVVRGDPSVGGGTTGILFGDYMIKDAVVRGADIQGMRTGISMPTFARGAIIVEDSYLRNTKSNIGIHTHYSTNGAPRLPPKSAIIRNVRFDSWPGSTAVNIQMHYSDRGKTHLIQRDDLFVYDYNGVPGNDFRVFYREQAPDFIVPITTYRGPDNDGDGVPDWLSRIASPEAGLTNQKNWEKYGIAIAGAVLPAGADDTTHPDIGGYTLPMNLGGDVEAPSVPVNLTVSASTAASMTFTWSAATDDVGVVGYWMDVSQAGDTKFSNPWTFLVLGNVTIHTLPGLNSDTTYAIRVRAVDQAGNVSGYGASVSGTTAPGGGGGGVVYGDADGSGVFGPEDLNEVVDWLVGRKSTPAAGSPRFVAADVDGDGAITPADLNLMVDRLIGRIDKFPVEG